MIANAPNPVDLDKLRNIINLSEEYLRKHKSAHSLSENDWLKQSDSEAINRLLDNQSGLPSGNSMLLDLDSTTSADLMQCLKYYFRHLDFFEGNQEIIEIFCSELIDINQLEPSLRQEQYQLSMQKLVDKLLNQEDIVRVYCLHEILYLIHISLTRTENYDSDLAPRITATVAPMFQEAFGVSHKPELIQLFFEAFAHIVRDKKYQEPFHQFYEDLDPKEKLKQLQFAKEAEVEELYLEENHSLEEILAEINSVSDNKGNANLEISEGDDVMARKKTDKSKLEVLDRTKDEGEVASERGDKKIETRAQVRPPVSVSRKAEVHIKAKPTDRLKAVKIDKESVENSKETHKLNANNKAGQKFKYYASATGQKLKTTWQTSQPKIIQFWHYAVSKVKIFVIWAWPKVKWACKKTFEVISNGVKKLYRAVKNRIQKKNDSQ